MTRTEHLLICLAEECAEIIQRVSKAIRFGLQEVQPGQLLTNAQRIVEEVHDFCGVLELLTEDGTFGKLSDQEIQIAIEAKKKKLEKYMQCSRACGALT
jgi:hypothetical protein